MAAVREIGRPEDDGEPPTTKPFEKALARLNVLVGEPLSKSRKRKVFDIDLGD